MRHVYTILYIVVPLLILSCTNKQERGMNGAFAPEKPAAKHTANNYDLDAISRSGELIVATLSGPDTYFDYQGQPMGLQYALAADFAHREGVSIRIETAHDTTELLDMLTKGDADLIALPLPVSRIKAEKLAPAGATDKARSTSWAIRSGCPDLAQALQDWYDANPLIAVARKEKIRFDERHQVRRHVRAPYLSREKGVISAYDAHFRQAAANTGLNWRLIAAQCYQESGFDPNAVSWAGARGLMQIMPRTAQGLGVSPDELYSPEVNISAAARYLNSLSTQFADIRDHSERISFILAAYNGGPGHIRDAMALAKKHGRNAHSWNDVSFFVRHLTEARYYRDPVVRYGYMIGNETYNYVEAVLARWQAYGGKPGMGISPQQGTPASPRQPRKRNRFSKEQQVLTPEELERLGTS